MVYFPCVDVTGHIPFANGANVNIRFLLHNAVPHRKLVSTDRSMVYWPRLYFTGHIPFASGAMYTYAFSCTTPSFTENWFPQTVRWFIFPVLTSLATFPLQAGQMYTYAFSGPRRGVGGTRALAHSIYIYICTICINGFCLKIGYP